MAAVRKSIDVTFYDEELKSQIDSTVTVSIDLTRLAHQYARKAHLNRSKKTTALHGLISIEIEKESR